MGYNRPKKMGTTNIDQAKSAIEGWKRQIEILQRELKTNPNLTPARKQNIRADIKRYREAIANKREWLKNNK